MIWSHVRNGALAAVVLTVTLPVAAAAAPFNYTFDADAQGWISVAVGPRSHADLQSDGREPWRIHRGGAVHQHRHRNGHSDTAARCQSCHRLRCR